VVRFHRPTSLFPLCTLSTLFQHLEPVHTTCLCPAHVPCVPCTLSMSERYLTSSVLASCSVPPLALYVPTHQLTSFGLFPHACETPVPLSPVYLALAYLDAFCSVAVLVAFRWCLAGASLVRRSTFPHTVRHKARAGLLICEVMAVPDLAVLAGPGRSWLVADSPQGKLDPKPPVAQLRRPRPAASS